MPGVAWTDQERHHLLELVDGTKSARMIAAEHSRRYGVKRTHNAVKDQLKVYGGYRRLIAQDALKVYGSQQLAQMFCTHHSTVDRWRRDGLIEGKRQLKMHKRGQGAWRYTDEAVYAFAANPVGWVDWQIEKLADPDLYEHAVEVRQDKPHYVASYDVARHFNYSGTAVRAWHAQGLLRGRIIRHVLYFWSEDVAVFVPPSMR